MFLNQKFNFPTAEDFSKLWQSVVEQAGNVSSAAKESWDNCFKNSNNIY